MYGIQVSTARQLQRRIPVFGAHFLSTLLWLNLADIASSPYSIPSYTVNEALGGKEGLLVFREKLHGYGIKLMLDFVPNHLALDNEWLPEHPEFFVPVSKAEQSQDPGSGFEYATGNIPCLRQRPLL